MRQETEPTGAGAPRDSARSWETQLSPPELEVSSSRGAGTQPALFVVCTENGEGAFLYLCHLRRSHIGVHETGSPSGGRVRRDPRRPGEGEPRDFTNSWGGNHPRPLPRPVSGRLTLYLILHPFALILDVSGGFQWKLNSRYCCPRNTTQSSAGRKPAKSKSDFIKQVSGDPCRCPGCRKVRFYSATGLGRKRSNPEVLGALPVENESQVKISRPPEDTLGRGGNRIRTVNI